MSELARRMESAELQQYLDVDLRKEALRAVKTYFDEKRVDGKSAANSQVRTITNVLACGGVEALRQLATKQAEKSTNKVNAAFWRHICDLLRKGTGSSGHVTGNLQAAVEWLLEGIATTGLTKAERRNLEQRALEALAPVYFEHFVCDYFYTRQRQGGK